jgi:hypothetical protein
MTAVEGFVEEGEVNLHGSVWLDIGCRVAVVMGGLQLDFIVSLGVVVADQFVGCSHLTSFGFLWRKFEYFFARFFNLYIGRLTVSLFTLLFTCRYHPFLNCLDCRLINLRKFLGGLVGFPKVSLSFRVRIEFELIFAATWGSLRHTHSRCLRLIPSN